MIFDDLGYAKSVIFIGRGNKICNLAENEFGQFWTDLDLILAALGVPGGV